jgi:hypothetical protein
MTMTPDSSAGLDLPRSSLVRRDQIARPDGRPQRVQPLMRRYEAVHPASNGDIVEHSHIAPAIPQFEEAFSAFARGTIFQTQMGPVAVEDLLPGVMVLTADGEFEKLTWKGSMMLVPSAEGQSPEMRHLTRMAAEAMDLGRPSNDTVFGPSTRIVHRAPGIKTLTGQTIALVPLRDFVDGVNIVELPPMKSVQVFHLAFAEHQRLVTGGIEVESYHPGLAHRFPLRGDLLRLFMTLFPQMLEFTEFGAPMAARLRLQDLDLFNAA